MCVNGIVYFIVLIWFFVFEIVVEDVVDENYVDYGALSMF